MNILKYTATFLCIVAFFTPLTLFGFQAENSQYQPQRLFESESIIDIRLEGDIESLLEDRGDDPSFHIITMHAKDNDWEESLDLRVRVRGNFRRLKKNCDTPPLKFNFKKHMASEESLFAGQPELKLVVPCKGDEYVVREYLTYKIYNLFTDYSFNVRMVRLTFDDTGRNEATDPQYGFLIEDKHVLGARSQAALIERDNLRPQIVKQEHFLRMSVFAYMIGNTDWSIQYLHNVELLFLKDEKVFVSVPYDFDLVGLVSSPYARPEPALKLRSVRDRVYRGYCMEDLSVLNPTIAQFQELKPQIYSIITENPLLEERYISFATEFLDDFYDTLNDPKDFEREFSYPCKSYGTGNVVISGMQDG
jgi:hypothetical protein